MNKHAVRFLSLLLALAMGISLLACANADSITETILNTGTTQAFTDEPVPEEDIRTILRAGLSTESAINQQPWYFVAITDKDLMKEIAGSGMGFGGRPGQAPEGKEGSMPPPDAPADMPAGENGDRPAMPAMPGGAGGAKASLGDSPLAIIVYMNTDSKSPSPEYDCGLATQNMVLAASGLGYGVKIVSSPTMSLNGDKHDEICEKLGVDKNLKAVAVLLVGKADTSVDGVSGASVREDMDAKSVIR